MSNQLLSIKCSICDYIALVTYNRHFEYSCQQELDTVGCSRCNQLSIVPVTKEASYPHPTREEFRLIYDADKEKYFRDFELLTSAQRMLNCILQRVNSNYTVLYVKW